MAESSVCEFSLTTWYVSSEIIPAGRPFLGFTSNEGYKCHKPKFRRQVHTIVVQIRYNLGEALLGLFVEIGDGDTSGKNGVIRVLCCEVRGSLGSKVLRTRSGDCLTPEFGNVHPIRLW